MSPWFVPPEAALPKLRAPPTGESYLIVVYTVECQTRRYLLPPILRHSILTFFSPRSLLRAARDAENPHSLHYTSFVEAVRLEHIQVAEGELKSPQLRDQLVTDINGECERVLKVLEAAQTLGEISARCVDKVISAGEKLSCRVMAAFLQDRGVPAEYVDLADIIDFAIGAYGLDQGFYDRFANVLGERIGPCIGKVPVVTGYFGTIPGGLLDQVGRGYTDLCAALVAVGIRAREL